MADLNIPNLNKKSDKYLFKNKLPLRRKSSGRLIREIFIMLILSLLIVYLNYLIPNKFLLINSFLGNLEKILVLTLEILSLVLEIFLVLFILASLMFSLVLFLGAMNRIMKVIKKKTKNFN